MSRVEALIRIYGFALLVVCGVTPAADDLRPPLKYRLAVEMNLKSNLPNRRVEREASEKIEGSPILHWEVPVEDIPKDKLHESELMDAATRRFLFVERSEGGLTRRYLRVFARATDDKLIEAYKKYGEPKKQFLGVKLTSHATYFMWDPKAPTDPPFSVKFLGDERLGWAAEQGVKMSDVIERTMKDTPAEGVAFFPERFAVSHLGNTQIVRSWEPVGLTQGKNEMLLPAHGILGSKETMLRLARAAGHKSAEEWIMREYLPQLGKTMAQLHFAHGVYPELHTQNLTLNVDFTTGKVRGMVFQDITDAMVDPATRLLGNRAAHLEGMRHQAAASVLHTRHIEDNTESVMQNFIGYVSQSVLNWIDFHSIDAETAEIMAKISAAAYLAPYLEKTAELTKTPIELGEIGMVAQKMLFGGKVDEAKVREHFPNIDKVGPKERVAYLLGVIAQDAGQHQFARLFNRNADEMIRKMDQKMLRELFIKQAHASLYQAWNKRDGEAIARAGYLVGNVEYLYLPGKGIIALKDGQLAAMAHSIGHDDERRLHAAIPAHARKGKYCGPDYKEI